MKCNHALKRKYEEFSNTLKIPLIPSTWHKIYNVEDLHVPIVLKESEISPDLPEFADIKAEDVFKSPNVMKKKTLLFGPTGVGKTTEVKMWLYQWCKIDGPLRDFTVVFYIDAEKLEPGSSLGEAITSQCLPSSSGFSPADVENMCRENQEDVLVILDNYSKWRKTDQGTGSKPSSLLDMVLFRDFEDLTVLVVTISDAVSDFREVYANYNHIKVKGISNESVLLYCRKVFTKRPEFGVQVKKYLDDEQLTPKIAESPVLLCVMCQIVKWTKDPTVFGEVKTGSALIDKFVDCIIKQREKSVKQSDRCDQFETSAQPPAETPAGPSEEECSTKPKVRATHPHCTIPGQSLSKEQALEQLSSVAFHRYLKDNRQAESFLTVDDFVLCGGLAADVLKEGCRLGLLYEAGEDEFIPSSLQTAGKRVFRFLNPIFQQRLASKCFAKLPKGSHEDRKLFATGLKRIAPTDDPLAIQNLLLFSCSESKDAAKSIISHVVELTKDFVKEKHLELTLYDGVLRQSHGQYQDIAQFLLSCNYEARAGGCFNHILRPLVSDLRILSPTATVIKSLAYLLQYATPHHLPTLGNVNIQLLDVPSHISKKLPFNKNITYSYDDQARVDIAAITGMDELVTPSPSESSSIMTHSITKPRLSITIEPTNTKGGQHSSLVRLAPRFPPQNVPVEEDISLPYRDVRQETRRDDSSSTHVTESSDLQKGPPQ